MTTKSGMAPVHPGEVLRDELDDVDLSASSLAKAIDVPANRITAILNGERGITADTALRLGRYFDTTTQFWLNLQQSWQIRQAEMDASARSLERIVPRETEALRNAARAMHTALAVPDPTANVLRAIERNLTLCNQLHSVERSFRIVDLNSQLLHAIEGPLEELRTAGVFNTALRNHLAHTSQWLADYESRFRIPAITEISGLMSKLTADSTQASETIAASIASLQSPWLDTQNTLGSVERLVDLHDIGETISKSSSFESAFVERLRRSLGDWRDPITWSPSTWSDLGARADCYVDLGFDTNLTDLPTPAFREVTRVTEVRPNPPLLVEAYGPPVVGVSDAIGRQHSPALVKRMTGSNVLRANCGISSTMA